MTTDSVATGLSKDLPYCVVMPAVLGGVELAVWRSTTGRLSAWKDRCPHRGMRLSLGFVRGETLSCIYHGWVYGTDGACNRIPAHPELVPPAAIKAETYSCVEAAGVIWIGPTDANGTLPDLGGLHALRSMRFDCRFDAIAQALPGFDASDPGVLRGVIDLAGASVNLCLLLQNAGLERTIIHALCDAAGKEVAVSRWLEGLRRRVEEAIAA